MRVRTLLAITLMMFALPALAAETPGAPVPSNTPPMLPPLPGGALDANGTSDVSVVFEVRTIKAPVGFCEKAGVKLTGNAVLGDDDMQRLLKVAQASPRVSVMQFPKITADDSQTATARNTEQQLFVTSIEATKVKGTTVLVPKSTAFELGDILTVCGKVSRDGQSVAVKADLTRVRVAGSVELVPVITQITPVFEGGSQGKPIPFTQYLQAPDVRTEKVEKHVMIAADHAIVLGSWKETAEPTEQPKRNKLLPRKEKPAEEYEVIAFVTVRVLRADKPAVAPMPREAGNARAYPLRNVAAAEAVGALAKHLEGKNLKARVTFDVASNTVFVQAESALMEKVFDILAKLDEKAGTARLCQVVRLRNVAAADAAHAVNTFLTSKKLTNVIVVGEAVSNSLLVSAEPAQFQQVIDLITALDKAPTQVMLQAMVIQAPRGFLEASGLTAGGDLSAKPCVLSPREVRMFTALLRNAKEKGELDVLSRPQICVSDNQTGFVQVGQNFPVTTRNFVKTADGRVAAEATIEYVPTGFSMRLTPRVSPDGKSILLRTEGQLTTVSPALVAIGNPADPQAARTPVFNTQQVSSTTEVRIGDTLVTAMVGGETGGRSFIGAVRRNCVADKFETLVIITPHIVLAEPVRPAGGWGQK